MNATARCQFAQLFWDFFYSLAFLFLEKPQDTGRKIYPALNWPPTDAQRLGGTTVNAVAIPADVFSCQIARLCPEANTTNLEHTWEKSRFIWRHLFTIVAFEVRNDFVGRIDFWSVSCPSYTHHHRLANHDNNRNWRATHVRKTPHRDFIGVFCRGETVYKMTEQRKERKRLHLTISRADEQDHDSVSSGRVGKHSPSNDTPSPPGYCPAPPTTWVPDSPGYGAPSPSVVTPPPYVPLSPNYSPFFKHPNANPIATEKVRPCSSQSTERSPGHFRTGDQKRSKRVRRDFHRLSHCPQHSAKRRCSRIWQWCDSEQFFCVFV